MTDYTLSIKVPCPNCGHEVPIDFTDRVRVSSGLSDKIARELEKIDDDPPTPDVPSDHPDC